MSLSPTATEMLYAIGAGSQVKAVDSLSDYPPQAPRTKLSAYQPNVEAIVAREAGPGGESPATPAQLTKRLAAFKIPVLDAARAGQVAGEYAEFDQLGRATGHPAQAEQEVARLRSQLHQITAAAPHHAKPLTYYYELDQTYYSVTSATFVGQLLALLGMKSIADQADGAARPAATRSCPRSTSSRPTRTTSSWPTPCAAIRTPPRWPSGPAGRGLTAVKDGHVIALNDDIASRWGPRVTDLLRTVETAVAKGSPGETRRSAARLARR